MKFCLFDLTYEVANRENSKQAFIAQGGQLEILQKKSGMGLKKQLNNISYMYMYCTLEHK